jgi:hypothetical protein
MVPHVIPQLLTRKQHHMVPHVFPQLLTRKQHHLVPHVIPQLITRNKITWCTWHKSMHHGILHPINNYLTNCVIKLHIKLQVHLVIMYSYMFWCIKVVMIKLHTIRAFAIWCANFVVINPIVILSKWTSTCKYYHCCWAHLTLHPA